jgi:hypothetical protein
MKMYILIEIAELSQTLGLIPYRLPRAVHLGVADLIEFLLSISALYFEFPSFEVFSL